VPDARYLRFDPAAADRDELLRQLESVFRDLLLRTSGDVEEALDWLERIGRHHGIFDQRLTMEEFREHLLGGRTVAPDGGGTLRLTPKGEQALRHDSFDAVFGSLEAGPAGEHRVHHEGSGGERLPETRQWTFGDAMTLLDGPGTLQNAMRRAGIDDLTIEEEDLRVHETEHTSSCATVMLVDVSHSMILYGEDRITPAKRVALALAELVRTRYPKDTLDVVLFGDEAEQVPIDQLPYISVGPFHTNTRAGLRMAQDLLRRRRGANRQIVMITDGKPSALTERDGTIYKNPFGLDERVVNKTLDEAAACRRLGIPVTTFMLTDDPVLVEFTERFTEVNRGRAYFSQPDKLGSFVLVDFVRNRRRNVR
jgi:Ca-activated chloride channel family protein